MAKKTVSEVNAAMGVDDYKPTIEIDSSMYKGVDKLKVDQVIDLKLKVKINNVSRSQYGDKKLRVSGTIENASPAGGSDDEEDD